MVTGINLRGIHFPQELVVTISKGLDPYDIFSCQRVSRRWWHTFTDYIIVKETLLSCFACTKEVQELKQDKELREEKRPEDWVDLFQRVTSRYCSIRKGQPRHITSIRKIPHDSSPDIKIRTVYPVVPWHRYLDVPGNACRYAFPEPDWTYEDGLLVYPDNNTGDYMVLDLSSGRRSLVRFQSLALRVGPVIVRRIRLEHRVLVIEFAQPNHEGPFRRWDTDYTHYVVIYDVLHVRPESDDDKPEWVVFFRDGWELGLPPNCSRQLESRVFSCHSPQHWAALVWYLHSPSNNGRLSVQEHLLVYDIGKPHMLCHCGQEVRPNSIHSLAYHSKRHSQPRHFMQINGIMEQGSNPALTELRFDPSTENMILFKEIQSDFLRGIHARPIADRTYFSPIECQQRTVGISLGPAPRKSEKSWKDVEDRNFWKTSWKNEPILWRRKFSINASRSVDLDIKLDLSAKFGLTIRQKLGSGDNDIILRGMDECRWETKLDARLAKKLQLRVPQGDERWIIGEDEEGIHIFSFGTDGLQQHRENGGLTTCVENIGPRLDGVNQRFPW
ncbi:MAG: hypothetical protein Q9201_002293 [Fulgogasparrea decipioides]